MSHIVTPGAGTGDASPAAHAQRETPERAHRITVVDAVDGFPLVLQSVGVQPLER